MAYAIIGITEGRPIGYPAIRCGTCYEVYHLPQSVRRDEAERYLRITEAREKGWLVPDHGTNFCPACRARYQEGRDGG
jgi:hypothetical protein